VPAAHLAFFESLLPSHRTPEAIFSHGGLDPRIRGLERQPPHTLIWGGPGFPDSYDGDDRVVYGHWDNAVTEADGWPKPCVGRRTIGIDTISHGVLTALRLPDVRLFQSRRHRVGSSGPSPV
jgi:hypothetical protein